MDDRYYFADDFVREEELDAAFEEEERQSRRWVRRVGFGVLALVILAGVLAGLWVQRQINPSGPQGELVMVDIPEGSSTAEIGRIMSDAGVISNATVWNWYTRVRDAGVIEAGEYELRLNSSFSEAIADLGEGPLVPAGLFVTVPEGFTFDQIVARVLDPEDGIETFTEEALEEALAADGARSRFLPDDQQSLEGTLFPETYRIEQDDDETVLVAEMVAQFEAVMESLDVETRAEELGVTPYDVVIVASLIENETRIDEERPQVARVIYNRLEIDMPLGIDATSCYEKEESPCELTQADFESDSPYNTRRNTGLPPTPISSPGRASLEAALDPANVDYLFYVLADEDGRHAFTASEDEFETLVQQCREAGLGCG